MQQINSQYLHARGSTKPPSVRSASTKQRSDAYSRREPVSQTPSRTLSDRRDVQRRSTILVTDQTSSQFVPSCHHSSTPTKHRLAAVERRSSHLTRGVEKLPSTTCSQILTSRQITASLRPPRRATKQHASGHWALATKSAR